VRWYPEWTPHCCMTTLCCCVHARTFWSWVFGLSEIYNNIFFFLIKFRFASVRIKYSVTVLHTKEAIVQPLTLLLLLWVWKWNYCSLHVALIMLHQYLSEWAVEVRSQTEVLRRSCQYHMCVYVCMYVCVCVCVCVYIYIYIYIYHHHLRFVHSTVVFLHPKLSFAICLSL
jgi:hypothetical protein